MKKATAIFCVVLTMVVGILCCCGKTETEKTTIHLSLLKDILSWDDGVIWNTEQDIFLLRKGETLENNIFQDPFYEKEERENISLQYIEKGQLYYIRTYENRYYELCSMNLNTFEETILYANCSKTERTYNYLGIHDEKFTTKDERVETIEGIIQQFCKINDTIFMMDSHTLYERNQWTKYQKTIDDNLDSDTELIFTDSHIYYKNADKRFMEYDRDTGTKKCLTDWMVQKLCLCGKSLLLQRLNGELYRFCDRENMEKISGLSGRLLQGDEKYIYCLEENASKLLVYDAETLRPQKIIKGKNIWGAAVVGDKIYYLESKEDSLVLQKFPH